jgi:hypothetical protein
MTKLPTLLSACLAAFIATASAHAEPMAFRLAPLTSGRCGAQCPEVVAAEGEIVEETPDELIAFLRDHIRSGRVRSILLLDSPGGKVVASMQLGHALRKLGMAVIVARVSPETGELVSGRCYSACVYALIGGRKRVIPAQSSVGVHRMFNYSTSFDIAEGGFVRERNLDDGGMLQTLSRYAALMGVSAELVKLAERTSPDRLYMLTSGDIARWRLGSPKL